MGCERQTAILQLITDLANFEYRFLKLFPFHSQCIFMKKNWYIGVAHLFLIIFIQTPPLF